MANSALPVTPGSGANIAVNAVADLDYQVVKLDLGADGNTVPATTDGTHGLDVHVKLVDGVVIVNNPTAGNLKVDASGATVPVSDGGATLSIDDGGGSITVDGTVTATVSGTLTANQGTPAATSAPWPIEITDGSNGVVAVSTVGGQKCLDVNVIATVGVGSQVDKSTFTEGTTLFEIIGGEYNTAPTLPSNGQAAAAQITQNRALHANLRNAAGTEIGTSGNPVRTDPVGTTPQPVSGTVAATLSGSVNAGATAVLVDYDSGAGSQPLMMVGLGIPASGGAVPGGTSANPIRTDPVGTTTQPVNIGQVGGSNVSSAAAGVQKVGMADGGGTGILGANPLVVTRKGLGETRVSNVLGMIASQTNQPIWTPASGKAFHLRKATITIVTSGALHIFDGTSSGANMIYQGTPPVGAVFELRFDEPFASVASNNVLSYTSGSGLTGDIVTHGFEV